MRLLDEKEIKKLEDLHWNLDCESPLEISNDEEEAFARNSAAEIVINYLLNNYEELMEEINDEYKIKNRYTESNNLCDYCTIRQSKDCKMDCNKENGYSSFIGRKLSTES